MTQHLFWNELQREGLDGEWHLFESKRIGFIELAKSFDLTVLGQLSPEGRSIGFTPDETVVASARPVLVIPCAETVDSVGRRALVAWDGTREAVRAVHPALPLLDRAEIVTVMFVAPEVFTVRGEPAADPFPRISHVLAQTSIDLGGSTRAVERLPPISSVTRRFIGHRLLRPKPAMRTHCALASVIHIANLLLQKFSLQIDDDQFPCRQFIPAYAHQISGSAMVEIDWSTPSKRVEGSPVYNRDGERLGTIDHIMLDMSSDTQYAVLRFATSLGICERYYPVPWTKLAFDTQLSGYVADIDFSRLAKAPNYNKDSQPESPDFRYVDEYWGSRR